MSVLSLFLFFFFCLGAPWPLIFLFFLILILVSLNMWLVPGGYAWRVAASPTAPGPSGWPLLGCIPSMGHLAHRRLWDLARSHRADRLMAFSLGATPVVVSSHPDTAREILCGAAFSDRPTKTSARLLMFERAVGFAPSGDYWRHLRRLASSNLFSPRRIAASEVLRRRVADCMIEQVGREMEMRGEVLMRGLLQKGSFESVVGSVFGECLAAAELEEMVKEGYELIGRFNWEDHLPLPLPLPFWGLLDLYGTRCRCKNLAVRVKTLVTNIIQERRSSTTQEAAISNDFLTLLLNLPKEEDSLSDSDMIAVLWEMIFRGTDVVAILLEWIMARIALHPNIQAKAQQEIDAATCGQAVQDSDVPRLPYLQAVVKEVLRMHPPGPLLSWARLAIRDVHVGKYFVPAGTTALVNMWAIAHDGSIWKDPWAFRPERFLEEEVSVMGSDLRLAPFGAGRRVCPGRALGLATVHLWLARLLQHYTWVPAHRVRLSECLRLSMELKKPLVCRALRRPPFS